MWKAKAIAKTKAEADEKRKGNKEGSSDADDKVIVCKLVTTIRPSGGTVAVLTRLHITLAVSTVFTFTNSEMGVVRRNKNN